MRARIARAAIRLVLRLTGTVLLHDGGYELYDWDVEPAERWPRAPELEASIELERYVKQRDAILAQRSQPTVAKHAPPGFKIEYNAAQHLPDGAK